MMGRLSLKNKSLFEELRSWNTFQFTEVKGGFFPISYFNYGSTIFVIQRRFPTWLAMVTPLSVCFSISVILNLKSMDPHGNMFGAPWASKSMSSIGRKKKVLASSMFYFLLYLFRIHSGSLIGKEVGVAINKKLRITAIYNFSAFLFLVCIISASSSFFPSVFLFVAVIIINGLSSFITSFHRFS